MVTCKLVYIFCIKDKVLHCSTILELVGMYTLTSVYVFSFNKQSVIIILPSVTLKNVSNLISKELGMYTKTPFDLLKPWLKIYCPSGNSV